MSERLGGTARVPVKPCGPVSGLHKQILPDMTTALRLSRRQIWSRTNERDRQIRNLVGDRPVDGDPVRLKASMNTSDRLVEDAIFHDPRLARRANWLRKDEGEHVDSALLAEGDDQPFYKHTRAAVTDASGAGEAIKIVVSTDDEDVARDTAAAFIATARIVQQFAPLEIWWQGAWLNTSRYRGFVNLVPLVRGGMDFSRLEFCIADRFRDAFSWMSMAAFAVNDIGQSWNGCGTQADRSYLDDGKFVHHRGITADGEHVAIAAAYWLGWETLWGTNYTLRENAGAALQFIPAESAPMKYTPPTNADRERWKREEKQREEEAARINAARLKAAAQLEHS